MSRYAKSFPVYPTSSGNLATSASSGGGANASVAFTTPGTTGIRNYLTDVAWSYDATPETGGLKVYNGTSSGALIMDLSITAGGAGSLSVGPIGATPGSALTVQLLQAGSSIIGRLNAYGFKE